MSINVTVHGNPISINRGKMVSLDSDTEFAVRRKIRLQQVRQQSKEIAEDVRNKVKNERKKQFSKNLNTAKKNLNKKKKDMLQTLSEQYQNNLERFGEAYRNAEQEVNPEEIIKQVEEHNRKKAEFLGKQATKTLSKKNKQKEYKYNQTIQNKVNARYIEDVRAKLVSELNKNRNHVKKKKKRKVANTSVIINGVSEIVSDESLNSYDLSIIEELSIESDRSDEVKESVDNKKSTLNNENDPNLIQLYSGVHCDCSSNDIELDIENDTISQEIDEHQQFSSTRRFSGYRGSSNDKDLNVEEEYVDIQEIPVNERFSIREMPAATSNIQHNVTSRPKNKLPLEKHRLLNFNRDTDIQCDLNSQRNLNEQHNLNALCDLDDQFDSNNQQFPQESKASTSRAIPRGQSSSIIRNPDVQSSNAYHDSKVQYDLNVHNNSDVYHNLNVCPDVSVPQTSNVCDPSTARYNSNICHPSCTCNKLCSCYNLDMKRDLNVYRNSNVKLDLPTDCDLTGQQFFYNKKTVTTCPNQQFAVDQETNTLKKTKPKVMLCNQKNKSNKGPTENKVKTKNVRKTLTSKQENKNTPKKTNLISPKKTSSKSKVHCSEESLELPYVSTVIVHPEKFDSQPSTVKFYNHFNHVDTMVHQPILVKKISEDSIEIVPSDNEENVFQDKISKQEVQAKTRAQKAIEKNKIHQVYQQLMEELPVLKRQEQLTAMYKNKQNLHMSEKRLEEYEREKQNRMENAYENIQVKTQTILKTTKKNKNKNDVHAPSINPIITLKPVKKLPPSVDIKEPFKTLDVTESSSHILNVGQWEKINSEQSSENEDTNLSESIKNSQTNIETNNEKVITDLLQRINKQRDLLLQEAANLPSLVTLKNVLSEQEFLQLIYKSPPVISQPKILKETGTSPLHTKSTEEATKKSSAEISKGSSKRTAVTSSSSDSLSERKQNKKKPKRLVKRSKILIKEEATQTSPILKDKSVCAANIKKEEATQTFEKHIPRLSSTPSENSNSDKVCEIIIRAPDDKKVEITHRSANTDNEKNAIPSKKTESVSNYVIKVKESGSKIKSKLMEISAGTSYQSLPTDSVQNKNKQTIEQTKIRNVSNKELLHPQKIQTNIEHLVSVKPSGSKEINPRLVRYIKKLLCMSRQSIDDLAVSNVSDVSTPHESVVQTENNLAKEKLQSVMQHFNLSSEDIQKYLSSSTLTASELSLENEIKEIMKPAFMSSDDTSISQMMDPSIVFKRPCANESYSQSPSEIAKASKCKSSEAYVSHPKSTEAYASRPKSPGFETHRPKSPEAHASRSKSPAPKVSKSKSPEVYAAQLKSPDHKGSRRKSPEVYAAQLKSPDYKGSRRKSPEVYAAQLKSPDYKGSRRKSPEAHVPQSKSPEALIPKTSLKHESSNSKVSKPFGPRPNLEDKSPVKSECPQPSTSKNRSPERYLSGLLDDVDRCRPKSRKQFSKTNDLEKYTSVKPTSKKIEKKESGALEKRENVIKIQEYTISPQRFAKHTQETKSFSLEDNVKLTGDEMELDLDENTSRPKTATSPGSNQSPDVSQSTPSELLKFARETLGITLEEFNDKDIQNNFSQHSELTEYCQKKINKLIILLEKLRSEKLSIRTVTPDDPASITITSYLELPDKKTENVSNEESSSSSSTISQGTIDKYLLAIVPNPIPPEKTKKRKEKEVDVSHGNKFVSDSTETFVPMLQGIPKYGEEPTAPLFPQEMKPKPPPSLLRANMRGYVDVIPHELSTIVEADTLLSSRNTSLQQPKTPMKTPMKIQTEKTVHLNMIKTIPFADISKEIDSSSLLSGDYLTITPEKSQALNDSKSPKNKSSKKSPKTQKSSKTVSSTTTTNTQDLIQNIYAKSSMSGIQPLSDSTNTSPDELESLLRKFKLEWAISLVKKTEQALALSSSSSTSEIDSKFKSSDISATDLYKHLYKKILSSNGSEPDKSHIVSDLSSQFPELNELSKIQNFTLHKIENKSDSRNKSQQQRTSTPVQLSNSSGSLSKENLFKGDSEISSVRNSSDDNMFLTIPNISLNTTNCSLNKSKK